MTAQRVSSVVRQVMAIAAIVMGALTACLQGIHLPPAMSAVLAAGGMVLINIEHYLSDPSTGTPVATTTTTVTASVTPTTTVTASVTPTTTIIERSPAMPQKAS